ncbi:alpha-amylase family glycosyl hydrolase [Pseudoalteromonas gelatinilytica]
MTFRVLIFTLAVLIVGCQSTVSNVDRQLHQVSSLVTVQNPEWLKSATIYQINTRQFTPQGTLKAAINQLPRLKTLGIDIIWLMPIHPIGEQNRKGELGSPYSIKDYFGVSEELGSFADLKAFVDAAHAQNMYVILDWVANHTAWDNPIKEQHPQWYMKDHEGNFTSTPWFDWDDIIDLDFSKPELRKYMSKAMQFWVREAGIDGFRCDAAGLVPLQFWQDVRQELEHIKPVFMLAEWEGRDFHYQAFDASYAWSWWKAVHDIAKGKAGLGKLYEYYSWNTGYYPENAMRLNYVSNHDANAWEATQFEAFGDALEAVIALSVVSDGIPMIYNGQEAGNEKRLKFFSRDPINWRPHPIGDLYQQLFAIKKANSALFNGKWGAPMVQVKNSQSESVLSFIRENKNNKVFAVFNLSADTQAVTLKSDFAAGRYKNALSGKPETISKQQRVMLEPWQFKILIEQ